MSKVDKCFITPNPHKNGFVFFLFHIHFTVVIRCIVFLANNKIIYPAIRTTGIKYKVLSVMSYYLAKNARQKKVLFFNLDTEQSVANIL